MGDLGAAVLLATPRSASTAFERMMIERGDHTVITEPFSLPYYFAPGRVSDRFADQETPERSYPATFQRLGRAPQPVFFKDMAHHLGPFLTPEVLRRWRCSFLIRDPAWTLPSMARFWPDFTDDEAGYQAQHRAFEMVCELTGEVPLVIESDDLRARPAEAVEAWCRRMGIGFRPDALTWEPGMPDQWHDWEEWFAGTAETSGFVPPDPNRQPPEISPELAARVEQAREHYEVLRAHRLVV